MGNEAFLAHQMRAVVEMLREGIESKINKCTRQMRWEPTIPIEEDRLQALKTLQWVQARIQDIIIDNEDKDAKVRI
jgi:hypothetical protein